MWKSRLKNILEVKIWRQKHCWNVTKETFSATWLFHTISWFRGSIQELKMTVRFAGPKLFGRFFRIFEPAVVVPFISVAVNRLYFWYFENLDRFPENGVSWSGSTRNSYLSYQPRRLYCGNKSHTVKHCQTTILPHDWLDKMFGLCRPHRGQPWLDRVNDWRHNLKMKQVEYIKSIRKHGLLRTSNELFSWDPWYIDGSSQYRFLTVHRSVGKNVGIQFDPV